LAANAMAKYLENTDAAALDALVPILGQEIPQTPQVERVPYDTARTFHLDSGLVRKAPTYEEV
jgi:NitT/TauT family transport system substrate-binding protein